MKANNSMKKGSSWDGSPLTKFNNLGVGHISESSREDEFDETDSNYKLPAIELGMFSKKREFLKELDRQEDKIIMQDLSIMSPKSTGRVNRNTKVKVSVHM